MEIDLVARAREAEDTAGGLQVFLDNVPQCATDLSANMSELFAISSVLRSLDTDLADPALAAYRGRIAGDLDLTIRSLLYSLHAVREMFSQSGLSASGYQGPMAYQMAWHNLSLKFQSTEGPSLCSRLEVYRVFLLYLASALRRQPIDAHRYRDCQYRLTLLLQRQSPSHTYVNMLPAAQSTTGMTSRRYSVIQSPVYTQYPTTPSVSSDEQNPFVVPVAPEVPQSPTFSSSSQQTYSSTNSSGSSSNRHWAAKIFDGRHSASPFPSLGQATRCLGRDEPGVIEKLNADNFVNVMELPFTASSEIVVRIYWRPYDCRARIVYLERNLQTDRRFRYCIPLNSLKLVRNGSCLQLQRIGKRGKLELWANLRFPLYERMVLFYGAFTTLKRQDQNPPSVVLTDVFTSSETPEFSGKIEHDNLIHALRVFRDRDTGCVRFEVTPLRGKMKSIPIWTAFVTKYVGASYWMQRANSRTFQLQELHPYVFCDNYTPPRSPAGLYELRFTSSKDAKDFYEVFNSIRRQT